MQTDCEVRCAVSVLFVASCSDRNKFERVSLVHQSHRRKDRMRVVVGILFLDEGGIPASVLCRQPMSGLLDINVDARLEKV